MLSAHSLATVRNINASDGHGGSYIYLFVRLADRGLITAAHYPNCRHFLACHGSPLVFIRSFVGNPFRHWGGLRKFMGFLHEITRKHNPCPLRRMSRRLRLHSFRSLARLVSLPLSPLFRRFPLHFIRASALAFADRSIAKLAGDFTETTEFDLHALALVNI